MAIIVICEHCRESLKVADNMAGKRGKCPRCKGKINVPDNNYGSNAPAQSKSPPAPWDQRPAWPTETFAGQTVRCVSCGNELVNDVDIAGQLVECPHCNAHLQMPSLAGGAGRALPLPPPAAPNVHTGMAAGPPPAPPPQYGMQTPPQYGMQAPVPATPPPQYGVQTPGPIQPSFGPGMPPPPGGAPRGWLMAYRTWITVAIAAASLNACADLGSVVATIVAAFAPAPPGLFGANPAAGGINAGVVLSVGLSVFWILIWIGVHALLTWRRSIDLGQPMYRVWTGLHAAWTALALIGIFVRLWYLWLMFSLLGLFPGGAPAGLYVQLGLTILGVLLNMVATGGWVVSLIATPVREMQPPPGQFDPLTWASGQLHSAAAAPSGIPPDPNRAMRVRVIIAGVCLVSLLGCGFSILGIVLATAGRSSSPKDAIIGKWQDHTGTVEFTKDEKIFTMNRNLGFGTGRYKFVNDDRIECAIDTPFGRQSHTLEVKITGDELTTIDQRTGTQKYKRFR